MTEDTPDPENIIAFPAHERAYLNSGDREFLGHQLRPFSIRRQAAAQAMGNRVLSGRVSGAEQGGMYDGMLSDVIGVIYLCQCAESDVFLAIRKPDAVIEKAFAWAEQVGICIGSEPFNAACEIFSDIIRSIEASQFQIHDKPGEHAKKD